VYGRYQAAVREEYAALDEPGWRAGRTAVMSGLLARDPLYGTRAALRRWEAMARASIARELDSQPPDRRTSRDAAQIRGGQPVRPVRAARPD
jgi:predicted metal-dependent HD superfamily phosphohydrolase